MNRFGRSTAAHSSRADAMVAVGVVGEVGGDLDRDPAVDAVGGLVGRRQHVAGVADVVGGELEDRLVDVGAVARRARRTCVVVPLAVGERARRRSSGWW